jgi:hypothetical protein
MTSGAVPLFLPTLRVILRGRRRKLWQHARSPIGLPSSAGLGVATLCR